MSPQSALSRAFLAIALFSSVPCCIKTVALSTVPLAICRLGAASLVFSIWLAAKGELSWSSARGWSPRQWRALAAVGLAFGLHWLTYFESIKLATAGIGVIGFSTYGVHLMVLGWLLGRGQPRAIDIAGLVAACCGTLLLVPDFDVRNDHTLGLLFGILSGLFGAFLPLLHQHYSDIGGDLRAWGQFTFALPLFLFLAPGSEWPIDGRDALLLAYIAFGVTVVGHGLWVQATTALSTPTISLLSYLYLPCALVFSFFAIGETLTPRMMGGAVLIFAANLATLWTQARSNALAAAHAVEE
ncbi:MAG: DMT family transporter [Planctomycetota bacterium]